MPLELLEVVGEVAAEAAVAGATSENKGCRKIGCTLFIILFLIIAGVGVYHFCFKK